MPFIVEAVFVMILLCKRSIGVVNTVDLSIVHDIFFADTVPSYNLLVRNTFVTLQRF